MDDIRADGYGENPSRCCCLGRIELVGLVPDIDHGFLDHFLRKLLFALPILPVIGGYGKAIEILVNAGQKLGNLYYIVIYGVLIRPTIYSKNSRAGRGAAIP